MNLIIIVVIILVIACILAAMKAKQPSNVEGIAFESRETLFTPAERSFFGVLEQSLDSRYRVFGKVRLGDIVKPSKGLSNSKRTSALNRINQKHVDFVLCSASDLAVIGVVELDDQSHGRDDRVVRDEFVDHALAGAKISVARFSAKKGYAIQEVRAKLVEVFKLSVDSSELQINAEVKYSVQPVSLTTADESKIQNEETAPICSKCGANMVKRQAKTGPHTGELFWACSAYPKCRQVVAIG